MAAAKILIFQVTDSADLKEGIIKVLQGNKAKFTLPECTVRNFPDDPASRLERAKKVWTQIFPDAVLTNVAVEDVKDSRFIVRAKTRRPFNLKQGAYGIRHWMFEED